MSPKAGGMTAKTGCVILSQREAVDKAVTDCINEGILSEFLREHRTEVLDVLFTEYNEAEVMQGFKEEAFEDGMEKGMERINALNQWLIAEGRIDDLTRSTADPKYQKQLLDEMKAETAAPK